ncbi:hypothetical protein [Ligilactobacillus ceti]|uniref:Uncharacterized protein n=1 Tax=Ligilactobacillus ceti DSM 22408 TaxID=1122146 RepID=A0A0R2KMI8_9LACO|nr:hypothetical protein [Ligilactobacillus ceti]KRN88412.1 hypothetical protein IV53_GL000376 [Ligilactobacillus ceti DSM 22408]
MDDTIIEKIESRSEQDKEWRLSSRTTGNYVNVIFSKDLEENMKKKRNFSFNRFESEQINQLMSLVAELPGNYSLLINQDVIGLDYLPIDKATAQPLLQKIN